MDRDTCGRYRLGRCDGVRHLPVCACGAVGLGTCAGKRIDPETLPACCTERPSADEDEAF